MELAVASRFSFAVKSKIASARRYQLAELSFDLLGLAAAWQAAVTLRPRLNAFFPIQLHHEEIIQLAPSLTSLIFLCFVMEVWFRVQRPGKGVRGTCESISVLEVWAGAGAIGIVELFFAQLGNPLSRSFVFLFIASYLAALIIGRFLARQTVSIFDAHWPVLERVVLLGRGRMASRIFERLQCEGNGVLVVGIIVPEGCDCSSTSETVPVLGTTRELAAIINRERVTRVVAIEKSLTKRELYRCSRISQRMGVPMSHPIAKSASGARVILSALSGLDLIEVKPIHFTRKQEAIKRVFDIFVSALLLFVLAPLLGLIALLIRVSSPGPVLYRSLRVGKGGRHFTFFKFRSMRRAMDRDGALSACNEKNGHLFKIRKDPRITPVGRVLRRYSLDELPQLLNVLRGEMSLVGPRPLPAEHLDADGQSSSFRYWASQRSKVLPGLTGLWQITGRSELDFDDMTRLDVDYIRNWSLGLDWRILMHTPRVVVSGRGAY